MSKKPKDTDDDYVDPDLAAQAELQKQYEAEALAVEPEPMPARFTNGGATAEEKAAWIAEHGGPPAIEGVIEPGHAEVKAEGDVPPQ